MIGTFFSKWGERAKSRFGPGAWHMRRQPVIWFLALLLGIAVAYAAIVFRLGIEAVTVLFYGANEATLFSVTSQMPWWQILILPTVGGALVGLLLHFFVPEKRAHAVFDVIEARALKGGRMDVGVGLRSAAITAVSLGVGGSAGREGPVVHLGATLGSHISQRLGYPARLNRILLGCGVAAAISASFNAPLAGVIFALEVILGHYALRAFAPIVISSVVAAVISRIHLGDFPAFVVPPHEFGSYWQMPAFAVLGIVGAGVAMLFMRTAIWAEDKAAPLPIPLWARPIIGGFLIGLIAIFFPQVLGVGYEATDTALREGFGFYLLIGLIAAKIAATAITLASRFGGGVFSPSLYLGAMTGGAFGIVAATVLPAGVATEGVYAMIGMGTVAAAVLGAPISTVLIVFELTGDYAIMIALMVAVSISTLVTQSLMGHSYFQWQLERRGFDQRSGAPVALLKTIRVRDFMEPPPQHGGEGPDGPILYPDATLERTLDLMESRHLHEITVWTSDEEPKLVGLVRRETALKAYNSALIEAHIEEHR